MAAEFFLPPSPDAHLLSLLFAPQQTSLHKEKHQRIVAKEQG